VRVRSSFRSRRRASTTALTATFHLNFAKLSLL
jgi:hypothetical protein